MITSGFARDIHWRTAGCSRRSTFGRSTVRMSTSSLARRRRTAEPTMPRWPATQIRRLAPALTERLAMKYSSDPAAFLHHGQVARDHFRHQPRERNRVLPTEFFERLPRIAEKQIDLGRTKVTRIDLDKSPAALFIEPLFVDP